MTLKLLDISEGHVQPLPPRGALADQSHVFDQPSIHAVNAALASRRPLLVRGEPGIGKSQLARAVAANLKRPFLETVVDSRTEARDLLWTYDAVARLAEAQLQGALGRTDARSRRELAVRNYVRPGPLWWAFHWETALTQAARVGEPEPSRDDGADPANGCVVLIDEIDKAESEVPNGLLEALGNGRFVPQGTRAAVTATGEPPLVVISSNAERTLPDAFLRRCWVLHLRLPATRTELEDYLRKRAEAHFPKVWETEAQQAVLTAAIRLIADQRVPPEDGPPVLGALPRPGVAEFLDLLRAVTAMAPDDPVKQLSALADIGAYALHKAAESPP